MIKVDSKKKGAALFLTLFIVLTVIIMANIILSIMLSQSRLTHHQVTRTQAYYAALAGMNQAREKLRLGDGNWIPPVDTGSNTRVRYICKGCVYPDINDDLASNISNVVITIGSIESGIIPGTRRITVTTNYNSSS